MEIIEKAPAKINLGLDILHKREDGYHEVNMVMASIDLADKLIFRELPQDDIIIETDSSFLPVDRRNHVYQAASLLKEHCRIDKGVHIEVTKRIPVAAGMAGGSTDAAATLRGLNRLWELGLSLEELAELGKEIGSDTPYCVLGNTSLATGRGDELSALPAMPACWVVVVKPRVSVSTWTIFTDLAVETLHHPDIEALEEAIRLGDYQKMVASVGNSLETATTAKHPIVGQIKEKMLKFGADAALMSGSGPTVYALCDKYSRAQRVYNGVKGFCEEVYIVRTLEGQVDH